ncbi:mannose-P-dolichol utilization defect 1 protein [Eurytemora carolleeae]|uniref:mannose-P-dolichol utilization defect 1 protein n=1 Tax=Eurytemora carolleeae TaxID=1294199 RepID=UPI000C788942|nr:mannose-P-dolichol utilization defect 1 protein [Eurytemora carolleeae]|eukprot:XP_023335998.1 mannose-P-dolichol utilization defect 1 protein-like [Eurytemora affinis]
MFSVQFIKYYFQCFESVVVKGNIDNMPCMQAFISKGLGLAIVAGSSLVKFPQVLKIMFGGSAVGISFLSVFLELLAITCSGVYSFASGFPFSAYGESVFLAFQTALIGILVLWYSSGKLISLLFIILYSVAVYLALDPALVPISILWYGQAANIPMILLGKFIQIRANFSNGHTGQLSAITCFLLALGAIARIFTSIQETGDQLVILTYICSSAVNSIIALQVLWYWNADATQKKKEA